MIGPFTQGHLLPMVTPAAILRCIGRINFDELSASFFRFAGQFTEKFRPGGICNALCQTRKGVNLSVARQACTSLLIGLFAMGEQVVIQPTALFQGLVELVKLFLGWVDPILKHFMHTYIVAHNGQEVKRGTAPRLPQERSAPSIPTAKAEGFTARFDKSRRKIAY